MKKRIPFGTISITDKSKGLIKDILDSNRVSSGRYVRELEKSFARLIGAKEAVAVSSGTDADALALAVLHDFGAKREDEVIVPALSFVATGNSVLQAGFRPVFVDVEKDTLNISPDKIEAAITKKTRAIMPVHLMGKPAEMDSINNIAKRHNLFVVEDAAEAYGAAYKGKNVGTIGDMAAFSLYVAHIITTIEGGMVVSKRTDFAEVLRSLRSHGRACKCESCVLNVSSGYCDKRFQHGDNQDIRFVFERIGFSAKMNELEAAIGLGNLDRYHDILNKRRENLLYMIEKFREFKPYLYTIEESPHEKIGPHAFAIILGEGAKFSRNELVSYLEKQGIDTRNLFLSMPTQCAGFGYLGKKIGDFPNAEYIGNMGLHVGIHQDLNKEDLDYILNTVREFLLKVK
ncbi:MAG: aminotransferase DegT [Candidatus Omnitrophica bacterium CG11_big_fil_rev_8_21_14_0_20_42_13]|uniref:Aminotransferase DegT n=1 Tax=Candidatus Ghiorseimicrobium undicola TaxID=1974746 RepID=A0A2H0LZ51_9BACT|nr:MAG: aminotransferase DegT [Candidatus Omnitrophica bacterium CG11_big_fil_rev_8_21_14_0_20_42_13]